jgi:hypothetical protein
VSTPVLLYVAERGYIRPNKQTNDPKMIFLILFIIFKILFGENDAANVEAGLGFGGKGLIHNGLCKFT